MKSRGAPPIAAALAPLRGEAAIWFLRNKA